MNQSFSIKQVISESWAIVKKNLKFFVVLALATWAIQFIPSYVNSLVTNTTVGLIVSILSWLINSLVTISLIVITLGYLRAGKTTKDEVLEKLKYFGAYLLASIYYSLIVFVGIILLVVPGVIWALKYQFYGYLIIDKGLKPKEALAKSNEMTQGKLGKLFLFGLALLGVNLIGVLLLGIGLLVTIPISLLAVGKVYELLSDSSAKNAPSSTQTTGLNPAANAWKTYKQS